MEPSDPFGCESLGWAGEPSSPPSSSPHFSSPPPPTPSSTVTAVLDPRISLQVSSDKNADSFVCSEVWDGDDLGL
jgi:hypothetical protein